jgi:hypothetical protein
MELDPNELYAVPEDQRLEFDADDELGVAEPEPSTTLEDDLLLAESIDDGEIYFCDEEDE